MEQPWGHSQPPMGGTPMPPMGNLNQPMQAPPMGGQMPPPQMSGGMHHTMTQQTMVQQTMVQHQPLSKKDRKAKLASAGQLTDAQLAMLSPEQLQELQMKEMIKESQNPAAKLRKLKSPLSVKGCLLNLLAFVVLTLVLTFVFIALARVDRFDLGLLIGSMWEELGFAGFFGAIGEWFSGCMASCGDAPYNGNG
ncbi:MAG: hypothetical protein FWC82_00790 [Firmicutes bacterium]|nr:hypothetical protein [Bacillota bacterium]